MTISFFCVLIAALIPIALAGYAKFSAKGYDNRSPREFLNTLEGKSKRANYAQMNAYETFPPFAAGVIIAHLAGAAQPVADVLSVSFVLLRVVYSYLYVQDQHVARSVVWVLGLLCTIGLFVVSF